MNFEEYLTEAAKPKTPFQEARNIATTHSSGAGEGGDHPDLKGQDHQTYVHKSKINKVHAALEKAGFAKKGHTYSKGDTTVKISKEPNRTESGRTGVTHHHIRVDQRFTD